jgi:polyphosphate kinase
VLAIKQTLYRVRDISHRWSNALIEAARNGKDVTVVIELRARFDEEANLRLADRLQEAGVQVVYGVVGYKTHAKMLLIVRREGRVLQRYVHLSTGNYHAGTARLYTDIGLITANAEIGEDVHLLFQQMSGLSPAIKLKRLLQSPFTLHKALLSKIKREARQRAPLASPRDHRQAQCDQRAAGDSCAVRGVLRGRADRPDRARCLLPATWCAGGLGEHPGALGGGAFPGTQSRLLVRQ